MGQEPRGRSRTKANGPCRRCAAGRDERARDGIKSYLETANATLKPKTPEGHHLALAKLRAWAKTSGVMSTADLTPSRLASLRDFLIPAPRQDGKRGGRQGARTATADRRSPVTINRKLRSLKTLLNPWRQRGMLAGMHRDDIADTLAALSVRARHPRSSRRLHSASSSPPPCATTNVRGARRAPAQGLDLAVRADRTLPRGAPLDGAAPWRSARPALVDRRPRRPRQRRARSARSGSRRRSRDEPRPHDRARGVARAAKAPRRDEVARGRRRARFRRRGAVHRRHGEEGAAAHARELRSACLRLADTQEHMRNVPHERAPASSAQRRPHVAPRNSAIRSPSQSDTISTCTGASRATRTRSRPRCRSSPSWRT